MIIKTFKWDTLLQDHLLCCRTKHYWVDCSYFKNCNRLKNLHNLKFYCDKLRKCFARLRGLDDPTDPETKEIISHAKQNPHLYVLKPQREGGGNNLYDEELCKTLEEGEELSAYILMQRIMSPIHKSYLLRNGECVEADTLSELGIYGIYLSDNGR